MSGDEQDWPKEGEVLMCTVKKVEKFGAFVTLDEYGGIEGFIHISEVSTNWVKNIRDYFKEGRKVVVKVMRLDRAKNQVDLSLKRTTEQQKKYKIQQWKQRQKAGKLLEMVTKTLEKTPEKANEEVVDRLLAEYPDLYSAFEDVVRYGSEVLTKHKVPKAWVDSLSEVILANITLPTVSIDGYITMQVFEPNGVELLRGALAELVRSTDGDGDSKVSVQVIGPPKYRVTLEAEDYKTAESIMQNRVESAESYLKDHDYKFEFSRSSK